MDGDDGLGWVFCIMCERLAAGGQGQVGRYQRGSQWTQVQGTQGSDRAQRGRTGQDMRDKERGALWAWPRASGKSAAMANLQWAVPVARVGMASDGGFSGAVGGCWRANGKGRVQRCWPTASPVPRPSSLVLERLDPDGYTAGWPHRCQLSQGRVSCLLSYRVQRSGIRHEVS